MTTPTPEQFLAAPSDADEDTEPVELDPLEAIAASLQTIAERLGGAPAAPVEGIVTREEYAELAQAFDDLEDKHRVLFELVEEIEEIIKPSTSKLANTVRDAIGRWKNPAVSAAEPDAVVVPVSNAAEMGQQPPAHADVEEWRAYARVRGYQGGDIDNMNRSQIRTMLGIEQPVGGEQA